MKKQKEVEMQVLLEHKSTSKLKEVVSDLRKGSDIKGAILVEGKDAIIAYDLPNTANSESEVNKILDLLKEGIDSNPGENYNGLFAHRILDYKGYKVLAKKLKHDLTLLVMLHKRGYISLAMLDIENSIRRIDEILRECGSEDFRDKGDYDIERIKLAS